MDCETANELLLDLVYDELDEVRAAAVRKHVEACGECREALRRISRGRALARQLPVEEPPAVSAALQAAIAARIASPAAAPSPAIRTGERDSNRVVAIGSARRSGPARWLDRVGEFAMRRQVAMAAVFLLMIGVGLIFYQTHPRPTGTADERTPDVVPAVEVPGAPSAAAGSEPPTTTASRRNTTAPLARTVPEREDRVRAPSATPPAESLQARAERPAEPAEPAPQAAEPPAPAPPAPVAIRQPTLDENTPFETARSHRTGPEFNTALRDNGSETINAMPTVAQGARRGPTPSQNVAIAPSAPAPAPSVVPMPTTPAPAAPPTAAPMQAYAPAPRTAADDPVNAAAGGTPAPRGNTGERIAQLRTALAQASDDGSRTRIANELAAALEDAGRLEEAANVRAQARGYAASNAPTIAATNNANGNSESSVRSVMRRPARAPSVRATYPSGGPMRGQPARSAPRPAAMEMDSAY